MCLCSDPLPPPPGQVGEKAERQGSGWGGRRPGGAGALPGRKQRELPASPVPRNMVVSSGKSHLRCLPPGCNKEAAGAAIITTKGQKEAAFPGEAGGSRRVPEAVLAAPAAAPAERASGDPFHRQQCKDQALDAQDLNPDASPNTRSLPAGSAGRPESGSPPAHPSASPSPPPALGSPEQGGLFRRPPQTPPRPRPSPPACWVFASRP